MKTERQLKDGGRYEIITVQNGFILIPDLNPGQVTPLPDAFVFSCRADLADFLLANLEPKG
jgi:hypothetical protein